MNGIEVEEPIGWDAVQFTAKRMEAHGMDQPFSSELTFYEIGASLIKPIYDLEFINANITLQIVSDVVTNGVPWVYNGYLDLSVYSELNVCDTDSWQITVGILEDNFREKFKARQDVEVDLLTLKDLDQNAITPIAFRNVRLHCQELYLQGIFSNYSQSVFTIDSVTQESAVLPYYIRNSDFDGQFGKTFNVLGYSPTTDNVIFSDTTGKSRTLRVRGNIKTNAYTLSDTFPDKEVKFYAYGWNADGDEVIDFNIFHSQVLPINTSTSLDFSFDFQIDIVPFGRLQLVVDLIGILEQISSVEFTWLFPNELTLSELTGSEPATTCNGLLIFDFLTRLIYIMTGQNNAIKSDYFLAETGCEWANLITTGLYIRNGKIIDQPNPAIKTSFKKVFESLNSIFCLGWQYEQQPDLSWKIRIETADYFYQNVLLTEFNEVGQVTQSAMTNDLANSIFIGYSDKWKNIAVSGIFEIHTDRNYFVKNKAMKNGSTSKLELKSDIIASGYAIEFSRRLQLQVDDSGSSDRPNDYELFIIALNSGPVTLSEIAGSGYGFPGQTGSVTFAPGTVSYGSNFIAVSNSPIQRIYNTPITPVRNAIRWWKVTGMNTYGLASADAKLFFQVGEYYTNYSSQIESSCLIEVQGVAIAENADISKDLIQTAYQDYLFKPISIEFESPQSLCEFIDMGDPGNGLVKVTSGSLTTFGFIQESSNSPEDPGGGVSKFKLILSNKGEPTGRPYSDGYSSGFE